MRSSIVLKRRGGPLIGQHRPGSSTRASTNDWFCRAGIDLLDVPVLRRRAVFGFRGENCRDPTASLRPAKSLTPALRNGRCGKLKTVAHDRFEVRAYAETSYFLLSIKSLRHARNRGRIGLYQNPLPYHLATPHRRIGATLTRHAASSQLDGARPPRQGATAINPAPIR